MPRRLRLHTALPLRWFLPLLLLSHAGALHGQDAVAPLLQHAREYEAQQKYDAAEEQYKQALQMAPDNPEILKRLGILYQTEVKLQDSLAVFEKVLALQPQYPQTNFFMGVSYFALNNYESAISAFDKELATPHPHPKCRYYLALALESEGRIAATPSRAMLPPILFNCSVPLLTHRLLMKRLLACVLLVTAGVNRLLSASAVAVTTGVPTARKTLMLPGSLIARKLLPLVSAAATASSLMPKPLVAVQLSPRWPRRRRCRC